LTASSIIVAKQSNSVLVLKLSFNLYIPNGFQTVPVDSESGSGNPWLVPFLKPSNQSPKKPRSHQERNDEGDEETAQES
jgi:hypothetical protein